MDRKRNATTSKPTRRLRHSFRLPLEKGEGSADKTLELQNGVSTASNDHTQQPPKSNFQNFLDAISCQRCFASVRRSSACPWSFGVPFQNPARPTFGGQGCNIGGKIPYCLCASRCVLSPIVHVLLSMGHVDH